MMNEKRINQGLGAIVMLAVGTVASRRLIEPNRANLDQSKVLVVAFTNRTRDSTLDAVGAMTADWITRGLSETGIVQVVEGPTALHDSRAAAWLLNTPMPLPKYFRFVIRKEMCWMDC